ncbi:MAG: phosphotransacetylase family protein [Ignisphaera sp.]
MRAIYVVGERGKTILIYGLLRRFSLEGFKVAYFKPISMARMRVASGKYVDTDVIAIKDALNLENSIEHISPIVISRSYLELSERVDEVKNSILEGFKKVVEGKDIVIIEGYTPAEALTSINCNFVELAKLFGAKIVLVIDCRSRIVIDEIIDRTILYKCFIEKSGGELYGVILNTVPIVYTERVKSLIVPYLEKLGIKVLGVIEERPRLTALTVKDIVEALNAEVLEGKDRLNSMVEDILIGAMSPEAALRWFRRAVNAAIVTGGDRTDLIMQALETRPSVVILTGNLYPSIGVLVKARETGTPILLVPYDTFTTVERLKEMQGIITADSLKARDKDLITIIEKEIKWRELLA